jgi:hypothetical protein
MADSIEAIYADVPDAKCKGLCQRACGPVLASEAERRRIEERHGTFPVADLNLTCSKLVEGRCSIYADRPLICRLYGTTRVLRCEHGCGPRGGFMPERNAAKLLHRAGRLP